MFAIYSLAVLSLAEDECHELLGEPQAVVLPRYIAATKAALSRAKFMSSTSIVVLQALILHIFAIRNTNEPRAIWSLTGLAMRVAENMGMRMDGTLLGLSPFKTEIHRRIWWQIKIHDTRAAELSGQSKLRAFEIEETAPLKPANVNDSDLYPTMSTPPTESTKPTEMIWCVFRTDLANFAASQRATMQKQGKTMLTSEEYSAIDDLKMKDDFITKLEDMIETKYLRFCDPCQPLQLLTLLGARTSTNIIRFMAHHPRRWATMPTVPASEHQLVWGLALQLLEQYDMMQTTPQLRRFAWTLPYFLQWHAVIHILDTLRAFPLHADAMKAWRLIDSLYNNNSFMLLSINRSIFVAVGNLCLKAFSARTAALEKENKSHPGPPEYIITLQKQREAAKARRKAVVTRRKEQKSLDDEKAILAPDTHALWQESNEKVAEPSNGAQPQYGPVKSDAANTNSGNSQTMDDTFWLSDAANDSLFVNGAADTMNLDPDAILTQGYWLGTPDGQNIDWSQWDAWLGTADPARPNVGAESG